MELKEALNSDVGKMLKEFLLAEFNKRKYITPPHKDSKDAQLIEFKTQLKVAEELNSILRKIVSSAELEEFDKNSDIYFNL